MLPMLKAWTSSLAYSMNLGEVDSMQQADGTWPVKETTKPWGLPQRFTIKAISVKSGFM